MEGINEKVAKR